MENIKEIKKIDVIKSKWKTKLKRNIFLQLKYLKYIHIM